MRLSNGPQPAVHVVVATSVFSQAGVEALRQAVPPFVSVDWVPMPYDGGERHPELGEEWGASISRAHVLLGFAEQFPDVATVAPEACWFHQGGAGYEKVDLPLLSEAGVGFVSAAGAGATGIAEFVTLAMLSLARRATDYYRTQQDSRWQRFPSAELAGRRLTVIGAGEIGSRVCRLGAALGLQVACVRLRPGAGAPEGASRVHAPEALASLLPETDVIVLAAPLTEATSLLLGEAELAAMPEGALVVNVARAGLIDHDALHRALSSGSLGGAWLDVAPREPLPPDHALWDAPNLTITSHNAVAMGSYPVNLGRQCGQAVADWLAGRPVAHVVVDLPPVPDRLSEAIAAAPG